MRVKSVWAIVTSFDLPTLKLRHGRQDLWFDRPFDKLTAMSGVEWLTILSEVEGQDFTGYVFRFPEETGKEQSTSPLFQ